MFNDYLLNIDDFDGITAVRKKIVIDEDGDVFSDDNEFYGTNEKKYIRKDVSDDGRF